MHRKGIRPTEMLAPSLFHGYIESLLFFPFIPAGLTYLLITHPLERPVALTLRVRTTVLAAAFAVTVLVFFTGRPGLFYWGLFAGAGGF